MLVPQAVRMGPRGDPGTDGTQGVDPLGWDPEAILVQMGPRGWIRWDGTQGDSRWWGGFKGSGGWEGTVPNMGPV
jgi:hypothetical protein